MSGAWRFRNCLQLGLGPPFDEDSPEERLDKLEALLRRGVDIVDERAALLAPLLSLPVGRYGTLVELTAEQHNDRLMGALVAIRAAGPPMVSRECAIPETLPLPTDVSLSIRWTATVAGSEGLGLTPTA